MQIITVIALVQLEDTSYYKKKQLCPILSG